MPAINSGHNTEYNRTFSDFLPLSTTSKTLLVKVFGSGACPDIYLYTCIRERERGEGGRGGEREREREREREGERELCIYISTVIFQSSCESVNPPALLNSDM